MRRSQAHWLNAHRRGVRQLWIPTVWAMTIATSFADEPQSIPETVVTATRIPTPVTEIPAGVTVIDRQTIEQRGYLTLTDAL